VIRLVHWHSAEAEQLAARLHRAGFDVDASVPETTEQLRALRKSTPTAMVISLDRMPSKGRWLGMAMRNAKATRSVPILFAGGDANKVEQTRQLLPDAVYSGWPKIAQALRAAIASPPKRPVAPPPMSAYASTPLVRKLGIIANSRIATLGAPPTVAATLGDLPEGAQLGEWRGGRCDVLLWFARSLAEAESEIAWVAKAAGSARIWILWPKKASGIACDVTPARLRLVASPHNLTDYKLCSFDATWSGMVFGQRRGKR
jgi:hypothetical protein